MNKHKPARKFTCLVFFFFVIHNVCWAQPGFLDSTFNGTGRIYTTTAEPTGFMMGYSNVLQEDGKLLVAGYRRAPYLYEFNCILLKYNESGSLDSSFGKGGIVACDFSNVSNERERFSALAVQRDGKIIAGGFTGESIDANSKGILARFKTNGELDNSFGVNGKIISNFSAIKIKVLIDGKIMTLGSGFIAKYNSNGTLDSNFGSNGIVSTSRNSTVERDFDFQYDGKIISAGYKNNANSSLTDFEVTRYLSNGQLDPGFNSVGFINSFIGTWGGVANTLKVQPDEKILVAGIVPKWNYDLGHSWQTSDGVIVRYFKNGIIDSSFGTNGKVIYDIGWHDYPSKIELQSDGKILISGISGGYYRLNEGAFALARFLPNGILDSAFGFKGINTYTSSAFGQQGNYSMVLKNNRIYLSGFANYIVNASSLGFYTLAIQNDGIPYSSNSVDVCPGIANINFTSDLTGSIYQWQLSTDSVVFTNISNNSEYSGVNSPTLTINNMPSSRYGYQYRCLVGNGFSNLFTISVSNIWTGAVSSVWENPANWSCGTIPDAFTDVTIKTGNIIINNNVIIRSLTINPGATLTVATGFKLTISH